MEVYGLPTFIQGGNVVSVTDDVQNVIRDMKAISDRLYCWFDEDAQEFHICEHCLDNTDRLVFSVKELDQRVIQRLHLADHWHGREDGKHILDDSEDFVSRIDKQNEQLEKDLQQPLMEKALDGALRYAYAMDKLRDHPSPGGSILVPRSVNGGDAKK